MRGAKQAEVNGGARSARLSHVSTFCNPAAQGRQQIELAVYGVSIADQSSILCKAIANA
jgi:hypothetical protein